MNKKELWLKLRSYHFDHLVPTNLWQHISSAFGGPDAFSKAFAAKIARKHNWSNAFALKAISEYKKFVYLGVVSDFHVTPSKIIDVVWHEHILFTKAYREFCDEVICYQFDHHPELLPMEDETGRFNAQYLDTVDFYASEFGYAPPTAIWGETKFDKEKLKEKNYSSREKTVYAAGDGSNTYYSDDSLSSYFGGSTSTEFNGGDFGGGGASGDWSDGNGNDSGSSDSGGDSGDSGGCSGGCGGCGGGD
ncbi:MAG: hypothetical protein JNM14_08550 [Ferruginibacter sp.]|nr:hypothetical protein [Ferruginibacter sp.]